jgi:hypothetical protein
VPRPKRIESVFHNIPYDRPFENLYLAYIVGLTQLGLRINATLAVPNQGRLELGLALYRSRVTKGRQRVHIFESKRYRAQRSTSDVNGIDPQIHAGTPKGLMAGLRNIFHQSGDATTVPEMLASPGHHACSTRGITKTDRAPIRQAAAIQGSEQLRQRQK